MAASSNSFETDVTNDAQEKMVRPIAELAARHPYGQTIGAPHGNAGGCWLARDGDKQNRMTENISDPRTRDEVSEVINPYRLPRWNLPKGGGRLLGAAVTASMLWGFVVTSALAQDADRGRQIAKAWCSSCHLVEGHSMNRTEAPSFASIGAGHRDNDRWVRAWLMAPHPSMPDMNLSQLEIEDIIAYLRTLH